MKKAIISVALTGIALCLGCQSTGGISRNRAMRIARERAVVGGWKVNEYVMEWAKPMTFQGEQYWDIFFEGKDGVIGNHLGVWVDCQNGETTLFPGH